MEDKEKIDFYNELAELLEIKARLRGDHLQSEGVITMSHSESGRLLFKFTATSGDWSSICDFIRSLGNKREDE